MGLHVSTNEIKIPYTLVLTLKAQYYEETNGLMGFSYRFFLNWFKEKYQCSSCEMVSYENYMKVKFDSSTTPTPHLTWLLMNVI